MLSIDNYKVGDYVKLTSVRPLAWNCRGEMDKYLGKIVRITEIYGSSFQFKENKEGWQFLLRDIERMATKEEYENESRIEMFAIY